MSLSISIAHTEGAINDACVLRIAAGETVTVALASGGHWYGHGFAHTQPYPLETGQIVQPHFAVNNIQCPIWMCSSGYALLAETTEELDIQLNANGDGLLRLVCHTAPLTLRVFHGATLPDAQRALMAHLGWPNPAPAQAILGDSLFCTWTQYPRCITQERVLDFARQIVERGYPCSTFIIDDRWESGFGELTFSSDFPDPHGMVRQLAEFGLQAWLWVTPFVNQESATFAELEAQGLLVPRRDGAGTALMRWWAGTAGVIDVTNPAARDWLRERLLYLIRDIGVAGLKIDGGDYKYQPSTEIAAWHDPQGPSGYSDALLALCEEVAPGRCETRTAWLSQRRNLLWREGGKDSHWGLDNGLAAMVTLALHLGLMGYDVLIPDMIPGRVQTMMSDMPLPTDELMVRWTEATAFMPIMQFSYAPWNYGPQTEEAVRHYALLHQRLALYLTEQARQRTAPLLRPIWYDAPSDTSLYTVADEYMLGSEILVAPVVHEGATSRRVVLPPGAWRDAWTGKIAGQRVLDAHPAPCPGMPIFVRAENTALFETLRAGLSQIQRGTVPSTVTTATYMAGLDRDLHVTG